MKIEVAPFDIQAVMSQMENMFEAQAKAKNLSLSVEYQLSHMRYIGDEMRISQVLTNLISNACKYTPKGGSITVTVAKEEQEEEYVSILFRVKDTGIGIKKEDLEGIFNSFEQAENRNQYTPGTGLGLSISRSLVRLMGGELCVKSEVGAGSEFYFTIQLPIYHGILENKRISSSDSIISSLSGLKVLLAEDNNINAEIIIELLKLQKMSVDRAVDGQQVVTMFEQHPEGHYDLILMDINMPVKNGLEAAREIRKMKRSDAVVIPILAMTANTFQEDQDEAMAAGMTGFLPKPFDVKQLYSALQSVM